MGKFEFVLNLSKTIYYWQWLLGMVFDKKFLLLTMRCFGKELLTPLPLPFTFFTTCQVFWNVIFPVSVFFE